MARREEERGEGCVEGKGCEQVVDGDCICTQALHCSLNGKGAEAAAAAAATAAAAAAVAAADMEQASASELAAATAGRYMEDCCAVYSIPTAHYHFQSADALALAPGFGGGGPGAPLLLATFDKQGVAAWVVPPAGAAPAAGPVRPQQASGVHAILSTGLRPFFMGGSPCVASPVYSVPCCDECCSPSHQSL